MYNHKLSLLSLLISITGEATPGEYASAKSLFVVIGFEGVISIFPGFPDE